MVLSYPRPADVNPSGCTAVPAHIADPGVPRAAHVADPPPAPRAGAGARAGYDRSMPDRLFFTDSDEANALVASDPMALLVGFVLDQQVTVQKAFMGPLVIRERLGTLDAAALADADLEPIFRERPAIHRFPASMARRVHDLAEYIRDRYDGDAGRVWGDAADSAALRANLGAVLAKRFHVEAAEDLVPGHPTLGDVDSKQALLDYQATKRLHKAEWLK